MIVEGAIVDLEGPRRAYVRFDGDRVVEVGLPGTDSTRGRIRRVRGIVVPMPVNGHTHLGDAVATREPPVGPLAPLVRPPDGWKFELLRRARPSEKLEAMRRAFHRMTREGLGATLDFREEGVEGVRLLRRASKGSGIRAVAFGRPLKRPADPEEVRKLLSVADGIGLSSAREESLRDRTAFASACRRSGRLYGLHASENVRERPDDYLDPRPDLLVHLSRATPSDLDRVRSAKVTVAVCPRSNALFGKRPDLAALDRQGVPTILGTDNAMFHAPSIWRELEFAYVSARLAHRPVRPGFLARAALVEPWRLIREPDRARVEAGATGPYLALRLPPDDPEYQIVSRVAEHLIVRPGRRTLGRAEP
ncbi:MAG TPA: hypothetical protein VGV64_00200 [Thermoplasmata archaeon]|nr:hypothetical protein [Thermoplasmata archaeon]